MPSSYRLRKKLGTFYIGSGVGDPIALINSSFEALEEELDPYLSFQCNENILIRDAVGVGRFNLPAGTVSLSSGSATLTGVGTAFLTQLVPGTLVQLVGSASVYEVLSVEGDLSATLTSVNSGSTLSGVNLYIYRAYRSNWTDDGGYTNMAVGIATETSAQYQLVRIRTHGLMFGFSGLTVGRPYMVSTSPGGIVDRTTQTPTTHYQLVGLAISSEALFVNVQPPYRVH